MNLREYKSMMVRVTLEGRVITPRIAVDREFLILNCLNRARTFAFRKVAGQDGSSVVLWQVVLVAWDAGLASPVACDIVSVVAPAVRTYPSLHCIHTLVPIACSSGRRGCAIRYLI